LHVALQKLTFLATAHVFATFPFMTPFHCIVAVHYYVDLVLNFIFDNLLNVIKFRCTLNLLLLAILAVMDTFLSDYKRKDK